jgi:hypothetical protein
VAVTKRDYDSTVARIAGNILSGTFNEADLQAFAPGGRRDSSQDRSIAGAVAIARAIVAQTKRMEQLTETQP